MKRKYLALFGILSVVIGVPLGYQKWSEFDRIKKVETLTSQARQLSAISLSDLFPKLAAINSDNEILILYTGNTQSYLEPCGCYQGQSGGIARRATLIERIRSKGITPLVLDAGNLFDGKTPIDRLRNEAYLKAMNEIGYDAVGMSVSDLKFGAELFKSQMNQIHFPFISAKLQLTGGHGISFQPYIAKNIGKIKIGILAVSNTASSERSPTTSTSWMQTSETSISSPIPALKEQVEKAKRESDFLVLLSTLPKENNKEIATTVHDIDLIISTEDGKTEKIDDTLIAYSTPHGKTLGMVMVRLNQAGKVDHYVSEQIAMLEDVPDHPQIKQILSDFYHQVASTPAFQDTPTVLFASEALEKQATQGKNRYVGSAECKSCHEKEYAQWSTTSHAMAFHSLIRKERHFYPDCVSCHSTGFGYKTGFSLTSLKDELKGVGCETCHGPGREHASNPIKENIRKKVDPWLCAQCHNSEHHPGFEQVASLLVPLVDHSQEPQDLKRILTHRVKGALKPEVELFVMSFCPFGTAAEKQLIPIFKKFQGQLQLTLRFIATEKGEETTPESEKPAHLESKVPSGFTSNPANTSQEVISDEEFVSLHGQAEVDEDIRQVVIATHFPDKLYDYLLCRADHLKQSWIACARKAKLDVGKINSIAKSDEGKKLFRENIQRSKELKIQSSPTLLVNGKIVDRQLFAKQVQGNCGL